MITDESISFSNFYEAIIENAESHILLLDEQCKIISLNPALYWAFLEAYDVQLRKGLPFFEILDQSPHDVSEKWRKRCTAALKGISVSEVEEFRSGGQHYSWKFYFKGIKLGQSKYISIFCRIIDSQPRSIAGPNHERILRTTINAMRSLIWVVDSQYNVLDANDSAIDFFHKRYQMVLKVNSNFIASFPREWEEQSVKWQTRLMEVFRQKCETSELDHARLDNIDIVFETRLVPVRERRRVVAAVVSMEDITNKPEDAQLQQTQMQELIKLNNELDRFVYSTSHDLRAPLLSIIGVVNLMKRESPDNQYLKHIESSITKLDNFVTNVINYSRNNRVELMTGHIDFTLLVKEANESLSYLDSIGLVSFGLQINEQSPFYSDATRLMVILKNVLSNAYQFFDPWKKAYVLIDIRVTREYAYIRIEDNGIGMKPEIRQRAFEMFFRGSDRSTGAGLGLYIANNAVQKLNGKMDIRSTHGVGTIVDIRIPNHIESA